jgi:hypothetical protein
MLQSIDFKELLVQSLQKIGLSMPGLARAGSLGGADFGLAPCFYVRMYQWFRSLL